MLEDAHTAEAAPIACLLSGSELAERGDQVGSLFQEVEQVSELADGYAFRFPSDDTMATRVLEFVLAERACCPFFTFEMAFEPQAGATWVKLRGSADIKAFVADAWGEIIAAQA